MTTFPALRFGRLFAALTTLFVSGLATAQTPLDPPVKPSVTGNFIGNGKPAALKFVLVGEQEPWGDKEAISILFSEKDPSKSKKPAFDAMFGELGSALVLKVDQDGKIFGCEVSHSAHTKRGFSATGRIKMLEYKYGGGNVSGHVSTGEELDAFGEKWNVDLTFAAPFPEKLRNATKPAPKPTASEPEPSVKPAPKAPAEPAIAANKLALPKDAANVEYKALVKQIHCTSPRAVDAVTKELSASLKQQGWKDSAGSLAGKQNAILRREQGDATLTIMIQPAGKGCTVKFMTEGLDWAGVAETAPSAAKKSAAESDIDDVEAEANKALKEALKGLPKGL